HQIDYEEFIADEETKFDWPEIDENSPMGLCYTSGTTGKPKGVMYTNRSTYLHTITQAMTDAMSLSALDSLCGIVPMFHAMGWGLPFAASMLGCKQVLPHKFMTPDRLIKLMSDEEVTISAGVPTIWQGVRAILESEQGKNYDLSKLTRLTCGGSAPPISLMRWYFDTMNVEMVQGWGMTETNPLGTLSRKVAKRSHLRLTEDQQFENIAKAGLLMPGLEIEIFDDEWNALPHDGETVGELLIRGPWIAAEYYNDPQPDKFHDGWLVTGDVAKIDSEEYLIIADRSKDLIKSGGEWISSVDLENHIVALEGVSQAAVVARPHPKWDERPVALVILVAGSNVTTDLILAHCGEIFAKWQLPDDVIFVEQIPQTSTGKIDKKTIRAQLDEQNYKLPDMRTA
ncbi:MAG: acyl-CoA synthetase (AMP-forming)/AMP-acid ligase II, partial [Planctomycetaceae bacterium]